MGADICKYLDKDGVALPPGLGRAARYKLESTAVGSFVLMEKQKGSWTMVHTGNLAELDRWLKAKAEPAPAPEPVMVTKPIQQEYVHDVTKVLMPRVAHLPGIDTKQVNNYIYMLLCRNQKAERQRVVNTRWVDKLEQPIYVLYSGDFDKPISMRSVHLVDSLSQAQNLFANITQDRLPDPAQWCEDTMDYQWDPSMEILHLTGNAVEHIFGLRSDRLPPTLSALDTPTLLRHVREALHTGQQRACRDCAYALPSYSRKYDAVSMLLPLHIYTCDTELPEAVMLLSKTLHGYSLVTLVTPQQAYISVRAFRDPEATWLKGALI